MVVEPAGDQERRSPKIASATQQPYVVFAQVYVGAVSNDGMNIQFVANGLPSFSLAQWPAVRTIDRPVLDSATTDPEQM